MPRTDIAAVHLNERVVGIARQARSYSGSGPLYELSAGLLASVATHRARSYRGTGNCLSVHYLCKKGFGPRAFRGVEEVFGR